MVPILSRPPIVGYTYVALSTVLTAAVGFSIWLHHMFTVGMSDMNMSFLSAGSMTIALHDHNHLRLGSNSVEAATGRDHSDALRVSTSVLETHQSKRFPGAFVASLSMPWRFVRSDKDIGGYHVLWPRDLCETAMGKLANGDARSARSALFYLRCTQEGNGGWSQNIWLDGTPHWGAVQMDGIALPVLLADHLRREDELHAEVYETTTGPGWKRSSKGGYGEKADGQPFVKTVIGRCWPGNAAITRSLRKSRVRARVAEDDGAPDEPGRHDPRTRLGC